MNYSDFLAGKRRRAARTGRDFTVADTHPMLHIWQRELVAWACGVGRAAIWADTGLGKTFMQVEWLRLMAPEMGLIVAPLAVCAQTVREAAKIGVRIEYVRSMPDMPGLYVTNYEMVERFDPSRLDAVVLDEASILKQSDGRTRTTLIHHFECVPYRLACTATPAPNDPEELTNQAEFLGQMTRVNMLAAYFVHDQDGWRLKGHGRMPMIEWMSTWAVALRKPSDMGHDDHGYNLPGLEIIPQIVHVPMEVEGQLFASDLGGVGGRARVRRETLDARVERAASIILAEPDEPWLVWCGLNDEADKVARAIDGVNVHGSLSHEDKAAALLDFADGKIARLVTKPGIASQGLNYQHCARMVFVGMSDSYEQYYQAIRRCYRYGQTRVVHAHIVLSELESQIAANVARKEREASRLNNDLVAQMRRARQKETAA